MSRIKAVKSSWREVKTMRYFFALFVLFLLSSPLFGQSFLPGEPGCNPNTRGDLDGDGAVAFPDFLVLSANFGQAVESSSEGDIDCDGTVAFPDFLVLSANFGQTLGVAPVPEPSTWHLVVPAMLALGLLRPRQR